VNIVEQYLHEELHYRIAREVSYEEPCQSWLIPPPPKRFEFDVVGEKDGHRYFVEVKRSAKSISEYDLEAMWVRVKPFLRKGDFFSIAIAEGTESDWARMASSARARGIGLLRISVEDRKVRLIVQPEGAPSYGEAIVSQAPDEQARQELAGLVAELSEQQLQVVQALDRLRVPPEPPERKLVREILFEIVVGALLGGGIVAAVSYLSKILANPFLEGLLILVTVALGLIGTGLLYRSARRHEGA